MAENLCKNVEKLNSKHEGSLVSDSVTISVGLRLSSPYICSPEELLEAADKQLYIAKEQGRNQVAYSLEK